MRTKLRYSEIIICHYLRISERLSFEQFRAQTEKEDQKEVAGRAIEPAPAVTYEPPAPTTAVENWGGDAPATQWVDTPVAAAPVARVAPAAPAPAPAAPTDWAAEAVSFIAFLSVHIGLSVCHYYHHLVTVFRRTGVLRILLLPPIPGVAAVVTGEDCRKDETRLVRFNFPVAG